MATIKLNKNKPASDKPSTGQRRAPVRGSAGVGKPRPTLAQAQADRAERQAAYEERRAAEEQDQRRFGGPRPDDRRGDPRAERYGRDARDAAGGDRGPRGPRPDGDRPNRYGDDRRPRDDRGPYQGGARGDQRGEPRGDNRYGRDGGQGQGRDERFNRDDRYGRDQGPGRGDFAPRGPGGDNRDNRYARDDRYAPRGPARRDEGPYGGDRPRGDGPRHEPYHGDRPRGDRPYGGRPQGGDRPQGDRPYGDKPFADRPYGDRFADRPRTDRPNSDRSNRYGNNRYGEDQPRPERPAPRPAPQRQADPSEGERLSKRMSELGLASRREADEWIEAGWVTVDGKLAELGQRVGPDVKIEVDPAARVQQAQRVTILLNKPIGYVSGQAEDGYEPAALLVKADTHWGEDPSGVHWAPGHARGLAPAGRLDIDSTGLLVLTQDGRIARHLIGEDSDVEKEYLVRVAVENGNPDVPAQHQLEPRAIALLNHGLELDGVDLKPAKVSWANEDQLRFVLREGRKRQIRRMCELVGLKVVGLKRVRIGRIPLGQLPAGQWRYLAPWERF